MVDNEKPTPNHAKRPRNRAIRRVIAALLVLVAVAAGGFGLYVSDYYHAPSTQELVDDGEVAVVETDAAIAVGPLDGALQGGETQTGIVFYPGAKVDPHAYAPLANRLAQRGYVCVVAKMPFNLAFFGMDAASSIMDDHDSVHRWWVAGHSLGGVAAAQFVADHPEAVEGVVFLASYPAADLSDIDVRALSITGSADEVVDRENMAQSSSNLPVKSESLVIEGGNHAGFGAYGPQAGDGTAAISAEKQQDLTADAIDGFISG